jgi:hypothetical protein
LRQYREPPVAAIWLNAVLIVTASALPAGVSTTRLCARRNSGVFISASSTLICWLTAACVTPSSAAATVKLALRAALSNVASRFSEDTVFRSDVTEAPVPGFGVA